MRRYGFHGLSHSYCAGRAAEMIDRQDLRLVIAHLGNGASVSAVRHGVCVDTSMGFTPLEGLMMGTRSGSVDPGMLVHLLRHKKLDVNTLDKALNYESGLLGVSGISSDLRQVLSQLHTIRMLDWPSTCMSIASCEQSGPWRLRSAASTL
jgi:acetate kinase